jgi:hypothetical protein
VHVLIGGASPKCRMVRPGPAFWDRSEGGVWPSEYLTVVRVLTDGFDSLSVVTEEPSESFWEAWERIRTSADPNPLEVLQVAAAFSRYFDAAQKEAISFARSAGLSWEQIAESLGQSRQALWQRASRDASLQALLAASGKRRWEAVKT